MLADGEVMLEIAAVSDRGEVREENQDRFSVVSLPDRGGCVLMVADGMGGHVGGARAAGVALAAAAEEVVAGGGRDEALASAFAAADSAVGAERHGGPLSGTTLVAAVLSGGRLRIGNVGDSRAYVTRGGTMTQLTLDHSWAEEQIRAGMLLPDAVRGRNLLTRAVTGQGADADFFEAALAPGEVLILCTDGLWGSLDAADLYRIFSDDEPLTSLVQRACDAALSAGSTDNVTVVACRWKSSAATSSDRPDTTVRRTQLHRPMHGAAPPA